MNHKGVGGRAQRRGGQIQLDLKCRMGKFGNSRHSTSAWPFVLDGPLLQESALGVHHVRSHGATVGYIAQLNVCLAYMRLGRAPDTLVSVIRTNPKTVLVVDDSADNADALAALVRALGHRSLFAYDAPTGLRLAHESSPDVIFHDIAMPVMSGYAAISELRKHEKFSSTCIVAITAFGTDADRQHALNCGFNVHLAKPADIQDVQRILEA